MKTCPQIENRIAHKEFRMLGISQHISICGRNKTPDFFIASFYKVEKDSEDLRKIIEEHFIKKYKPNNLSLSNENNCLTHVYKLFS